MNKLEECARAIDSEPWDQRYNYSAATRSEMKRRAMERARAVIRCLMESDYNMKFLSEVKLWPEDAERVLRAMLQAVLDEQPAQSTNETKA